MKTLFLALAMVVAGVSAQAGEREYLKSMGIEDAWKTTMGSPEVTVAVLNTGVNYHLPEFANRIQKDENGNYGYDAVTDTHNPMDLYEFGLGTQVASVIAGNTMGIAPGVKLIPVRVFSENGVSSYQILARGLRYAIERGAKIVELSGGPLAGSSTYCQLMQEASNRGVLLIAPAGNNSSELSEFPENCPVENLLAVASTTSAGQLSHFSNYGFPAVQVAAQGEGLWAISRDGGLRKENQGTSYSSAAATGIAALVWSAHPEYSSQQVISAMIRGSSQREELRGKVLSNGLLNAYGALNADPNARVE